MTSAVCWSDAFERAWKPCKAPRSSHELAAQVEDEPDTKDPRARALTKIREGHAAQVPQETRPQLKVRAT